MRTTLPPALDDALISPAFYQNPYPIYEQLRADLPVVWSERMGAWLLTRYEDVITTLRDAEHFSNADHFDIYRQPNRHVAFGFGLHFCLGAPLARLEAPIAVQLVLDRMPKVRLATASPNWMQHNLVRGLALLPVVF